MKSNKNKVLKIRSYALFLYVLIWISYFLMPSKLLASGSHAKQLDLKLGQVLYNKTDGATPLNGSAITKGVELSLFYKLDSSVELGFREATDPSSKRSYYLAAYAGWRYFPLGIGYPVEEVIDHAIINYDASLRPFVEGGVAIGRALYNPVLGGAQEQAADVLGLTIGAGMSWFPIARWTLNIELVFEQYQARGGTSESLALSGNNIFTLLGMGYLL